MTEERFMRYVRKACYDTWRGEGKEAEVVSEHWSVMEMFERMAQEGGEDFEDLVSHAKALLSKPRAWFSYECAFALLMTFSPETHAATAELLNDESLPLAHRAAIMRVMTLKRLYDGKRYVVPGHAKRSAPQDVKDAETDFSEWLVSCENYYKGHLKQRAKR